MKRRTSIIRMLFALLLVVGLAGCATTNVATPTDEDRADLGWFTLSLQDEGVYVTEEGGRWAGRGGLAEVVSSAAQ